VYFKTSGHIAADVAAAIKAGSYNSYTCNPFLNLLLLVARVNLDIVYAQYRAIIPFSRFLGYCPNVKY